MKRHQQVWTTTAVPRMASDSGTALLRCMQPSAAEQRSRGAAVEPGPKGRVPLRLRAGFHCGSAAPLLIFRGLKRHHYHSDRGSSWSSESAAHRKLLLRFLTKNCEPRSRRDLFPVLCIVLYARILKLKF